MALDPQDDQQIDPLAYAQPGFDAASPFGGDSFLQWFHGQPAIPPPPPVIQPQEVAPGAPTEGARDEVAPGTPGGFPSALPDNLAPAALPDAITGAAPATPGALPPAPDAITGGALPGPVHDVALDKARPQMPGEYRTDAEEGTRLANLGATDPDAYAREVTAQQVARDAEQRRLETAARAKDQQQEQDNYFARQKAWVSSQAATEKLIQDSNALANVKVDPERWWSSRSTGQKIAGFIAAIAGGLTGKDTTSMMKDAIDRDVDAQKQDLLTRRAEITRRGGLIQDQPAQDNDAYHQAEVFRVASWNRVIAGMQTQMQDFDPHGTTAMRYAQNIEQARQQQGQAINAYKEQAFKRDAEGFKANTDRMREEEAARHNMAEEAFKAGKAGAGLGTPVAATGTLKMGASVQNQANPAYSVVVGADDPFTHEPLLSRYQLDKEQAGKQRELATTTSEEYKRLRALYGEMKADVGEGKGWDEVISRGRTRTTRGERYDELRGQVVSVLAKLNDGKTNIGILELNETLIPERKTSLALSDAGQLITDAMRDTDTKVDAAFSSAGIDASGMIRHAQHASAAQPQAAAAEREGAARDALAQSPGDKDLQAEVNNASVESDTARVLSQNADMLVHRFSTEPAMTPLAKRKEAGGGSEVGEVEIANKEIANFNRRLQAFHKEVADDSYVKGIDKKKLGDLAAAKTQHANFLREKAKEVTMARLAADNAVTKARAAMGATDMILRGQGIPTTESGPQSQAVTVPPELTLQPRTSGGR